MITGAHAILFAENADSVRAFFRDILGLPSVDAGGGWLIFGLPPAELAAHPIEAGELQRHQLYLVCDDVHATIAELKRKGVEFISEPSDQGWGILTSFRIPGGGEISLYQPRHPRPAHPGASAAGRPRSARAARRPKAKERKPAKRAKAARPKKARKTTRRR